MSHLTLFPSRPSSHSLWRGAEHNVAFGPLKWINTFMRKTDLLPQGPTAPNQVSPVYPYGSEPSAKDGSDLHLVRSRIHRAP